MQFTKHLLYTETCAWPFKMVTCERERGVGYATANLWLENLGHGWPRCIITVMWVEPGQPTIPSCGWPICIITSMCTKHSKQTASGCACKMQLFKISVELPTGQKSQRLVHNEILCTNVWHINITKYNSNRTTTHADWNSDVQKRTNTLGKTTTHGERILKMHLCIRNHNSGRQGFYDVQKKPLIHPKNMNHGSSQQDFRCVLKKPRLTCMGFPTCNNPIKICKIMTCSRKISGVKTHSCIGKNNHL